MLIGTPRRHRSLLMESISNRGSVLLVRLHSTHLVRRDSLTATKVREGLSSVANIFNDVLPNNSGLKNPGPGTYAPNTGISSEGIYFVSGFKSSKCRSFAHDERRTFSQDAGRKQARYYCYLHSADQSYFFLIRYHPRSWHVPSTERFWALRNSVKALDCLGTTHINCLLEARMNKREEEGDVIAFTSSLLCLPCFRYYNARMIERG